MDLTRRRIARLTFVGPAHRLPSQMDTTSLPACEYADLETRRCGDGETRRIPSTASKVKSRPHPVTPSPRHFGISANWHIPSIPALFPSWILVLSVALMLLAPSARVSGQTQARDKVLVTVNGREISQADLDFLMLSRQVPKDRKEILQKRFLDQLIERRLMQDFLAKRKTRASKLELDLRVEQLFKTIKKGGDDPKQVLAKLGYTEETLRKELSLPLAWRAYARQMVTAKRLRQFFEKHREEFDGTEVRASQILIKLPKENPDPAIKSATETLKQIRMAIAVGDISFADAARKHSEAPSKDQGGDVGYFPFRGKMPVEFTRNAFPLKKGEISQPFRTRFGMHLCTVTARKPGDLSLEDVRLLVFNALSQELWDAVAAQERSKAKIDWKVELK